MKKILSVVLILAICSTMFVPAFAAENNQDTFTEQENMDVLEIPVGYERIVEALNDAEIGFTIEDDKIILLDTTKENLELANSIAQESYKDTMVLPM